MQEVLQKIQELVTLLEDKLAATEVLNQRLSKEFKNLDDVARKQKAAASQLAARERIVTKAEDFAKEKEQVKEQVKRTHAQKLKNASDAEANAKKEKELEDKDAELEKMVAVFKKKNEAMDALKVQLENEKKLMREKVLKEIQGKL